MILMLYRTEELILQSIYVVKNVGFQFVKDFSKLKSYFKNYFNSNDLVYERLSYKYQL